MAETYTSRTLREIVRVVAGRFVGMLVILAVVLIAVGAATYFAPKWYRSEAKLFARPSAMPNPLESQAGRDEVTLFVTTQREIIMSDWVLASALMRLDGQQMPMPASDPTMTLYERERKAVEFRQKLAEWNKQVDKWLADPRHVEPLQDIRGRVDVVTPGGPDASFTQTFAIRVDWPEERRVAAKLGKDSAVLAAQRAQEVAKYVKEAYLTRLAQLESERIANAARFIADESLAVSKAKLDSAAEAMSDFVSRELGSDLLTLSNMIGRGVGIETGVATLTTQFQGEMTRIDSRLAELQALAGVIGKQISDAREKELQGVLADIARLEKPANDEQAKQLMGVLKTSEQFNLVVPDPILTANPAMKALQDKITGTRMLISSLTPRYEDDYLELLNARKELAQVQNNLFAEMKDQGKKIADEIEILKARRRPIEVKVTGDTTRLNDLARKVAPFTRYQADLATAQASYDAVNKRAIEATSAQKLAANPILVSSVDEPARPAPGDPRRPIVWLNMLIAVVGGLILSLVYAFLADHFDHTIKSIDDAERYLGTPVLASVPKLARPVIRAEREVTNG